VGFFALFDFCVFVLFKPHHLCTTPFKKYKKVLLKRSVQRPNKVLFGQKAHFETVAMTAHFPALRIKNAHFLVKKCKNAKRRTESRSTSFGKIKYFLVKN